MKRMRTTALIIVTVLSAGCARIGLDRIDTEDGCPCLDGDVDTAIHDADPEEEAGDEDADVEGTSDADDPGDADSPSRRTWALTMPETTPPPLWAPVLAYEESASRVILYGGTDSGLASAAMWAYDGTSWSRLCDPCTPGARVGHRMVYDAARARMVLYGGADAGGSLLADVWEWDGSAWDLVPVNGDDPGQRRDHGMAYDPLERRILVFGGETPTVDATDDLYYFDGLTWSLVETSGGPSPRSDETNFLAFDDGGGALLVVGGHDADSEILNDLWTWDGTRWTEVCSTCFGTPAHDRAVVWDTSRHRLVSACGWTGSSEITGTFELDGNNFIVVDAYMPPARDSCGIAFDSSRNAIVLYGGNGSSCTASNGDCQDTFEYQL